jgi:hypothetical protein
LVPVTPTSEKRLRGVPVEVRSHLRHGLARVLDDDLGHIGGVCQIQLALDHDELRAVVDGVLGERVAVHLQADDAEEHVAGFDRVGAVGEAPNRFVTVADNRAIKPFTKL